ncbi:MAG TPA: PRD domain-containing protein [Erysipelotrichaceae bacterium]|nr:PRD domain-containing protein [Erysipelotrichaceae bacterium]
MRDRLSILKDNKVINEEVFDFSWNVYNDLLIPKGFNPNELVVFMTHLAMSSQRILNKDIVASMESAIFGQLEESDNFNKAEDLMNEILSKTSIDFPDSEKQYLMLHIINMLSEGGGDRND